MCTFELFPFAGPVSDTTAFLLACGYLTSLPCLCHATVHQSFTTTIFIYRWPDLSSESCSEALLSELLNVNMMVFMAVSFILEVKLIMVSYPPICEYYWSSGLHDLYSTGSRLRSYEIYSTPDFFPRGCLGFSEFCQLYGIISTFHMRIHRTSAWHLLLSARGPYLHMPHPLHFGCLLIWLRQTSLFIALRYRMRNSCYYQHWNNWYFL